MTGKVLEREAEEVLFPMFLICRVISGKIQRSPSCFPCSYNCAALTALHFQRQVSGNHGLNLFCL